MTSATRRIVSSKSRTLSPWFEVVEAELDDDGVLSTWHYQDHPGAAIAVPVTPRGTLLLSSEYRISVDAVVLEVPGGRIDPGETPMRSAAREMFEEVGAVADELVPLGTFHNSPGSSNETTYAFAALNARVAEARPGTVELVPDEFIATARQDGHSDAASLAAVLLAQAIGLLRPQDPVAPADERRPS